MTDIVARPETQYRSDRVRISKRSMMIAAAVVTAVAVTVVGLAATSQGSGGTSGATIDAAQLRWEGLAVDYARPAKALAADQLRWEGLASADYSQPVTASIAEQLRWSGLAGYHLGTRSQEAIAAETQRWAGQSQAVDGTSRVRQAESARWNGIAQAHNPS